MPWTKIKSGPNKGKYKSPSGRVWTHKQIVAYLAAKHAKRGKGK